MTFKPGDRVTYEGNLVSLAGKTGMFKAHRTTTPGGGACADVIFDHENRTRVVNTINLRPETLTVNIKNDIKTAITALFPKTGASLNSLAKELLVSTAAASVADSRKKKAKQAAIDGGLVLAEYRPGEVTSYDDSDFTVVAKTKEPTSRLDQDVLRERLRSAGLSQAKIDAAFVAATFENKPATSYEVIQK